jgi:hypothetical protein
MRCWIRGVAVVAVLGLAGVALAEQVDNPEYKDWSKYKAGTFVAMQQSTELPGMADMPGMPPGMNMAAMMPSTKTTTKLTEVKPESLTLEVTTETTQMGQTNSSKTTRVVAAKIDKAPATATATAPGEVELKDLKEGKETVEINGKKVNTVTREFRTTVSGSGMGMARGRGRGRAGADNEPPTPARMKTWTSSEVPLGLVKSETTTTTDEMGDVKMTMKVVDFDVAK